MFVFVNPETNNAVRKYGCVVSYATEKTAKRVRTMRIRKGEMSPVYEVTSMATYQANDIMVEVKNLMTGNAVMILKSERGGCCDPSTETYWSM